MPHAQRGSDILLILVLLGSWALDSSNLEEFDSADFWIRELTSNP